jgi:ethylmalonyl-CoA/methylmalonyl-CoA decarboxylase
LQQLATTKSAQQASVQMKLQHQCAILTLCNPDRHNAMTPKMMLDLERHIQTLEQTAKRDQDQTLAVILAGEGKSFCAGLDLGHARAALSTPEAGKHMSTFMHSTCQRLQDLPYISVAAIDGYALGGGAELTTACDFRFMSFRSKVRFVQLKMGVIPGWGGGTRLVRLLGKEKALELLCSMQMIDAEEGKRIGFCSHVQKEKDSSESMIDWAARTVHASWGHEGSTSPHVLREMKRMVQKGATINSLGALEFERERFSKLWGSGANLAALGKS